MTIQKDWYYYFTEEDKDSSSFEDYLEDRGARIRVQAAWPWTDFKPDSLRQKQRLSLRYPVFRSDVEHFPVENISWPSLPMYSNVRHFQGPRSPF